ncbi:MAG: NAD-dependent epimerase/dehydratase family protein, partial [Acidobacteria bacterium]|nr:NAD-dependent epimerase/dehydratase family protein [Acidobacteriota bacterium]
MVATKLGNLSDLNEISSFIDRTKPNIVFHLGAQAIVREGYRDPHRTFESNTLGTVNVLEAIRITKWPAVAIFVTSDKVYRQSACNKPFIEDDALGGLDPYSASKSSCEHAIASYAPILRNNTKIGSARAGNVIGGGDWSQDRLLPDAIRAWTSNSTLAIRFPLSTRPWQHVLDCLAGYLIFAQSLWEGKIESGAFNFGPDPSESVTVLELIENAQRHF